MIDRDFADDDVCTGRCEAHGYIDCAICRAAEAGEEMPRCPHCGEVPRVDHLYPPIPDRRCDWGVWCDCREDAADVSYGPTREAAVKEWGERVADQLDERGAA